MRSSMLCTACNLGIAECQCPGQDERLREIAYDRSINMAFKWCRSCDKHFARCKCENPDYFFIRGGSEFKMPGISTKPMATN